MSQTTPKPHEDAGQPSAAAQCSAAAMRAAERILSGVDCGAVRYHGPRADGKWCWQYRSASKIAAIIEEEMREKETQSSGSLQRRVRAVQCSALLAALAKRFRSRAAMCRELEQTAVDETRWHDAATMKSHCMIWERAARMVEEERS